MELPLNEEGARLHGQTWNGEKKKKGSHGATSNYVATITRK
jgi:hypothetical protein